MDVNVIVEFNGNIVEYYLNLPIEIMEENIDLYNDEIKPICTFNNLSLNFDKLYSSINNYIENKGINMNNINIKFSVLQQDDMCYKFIKTNRDYEIIFGVNNFQEAINCLGNDEYPNLKIAFEGSNELISYSELKKMYYNLNQIVSFINRYDLSSLEKTMLAYDIVKSNKYNKENKDENLGISRNLNQILSSDKIVCVGFANLLDYILKNVGIESGSVTLKYKNKQIGHQRNFVNLKDDKYKVNGVFFLDATWDSKKNEDYLDNYMYFLKPFYFFNLKAKGEYIELPLKFKILEQNMDEIDSIINNKNDVEYNIFMIKFLALYNYKNQTNINFWEFPDKSNEELKQIIKETFKYFNKAILSNNFKGALYRVRKIEFINGITNKQYTEKEIEKVANKYFEENNVDKFFSYVFGSYIDNELDNAQASSVEEDLLRMRLLRALKDKIDDKPNNDIIKKM